MRVYQLVVTVVDFDEVGDDIKGVIEDTRYPNRCIAPQVESMRSADIGEWDDDHPLNRAATRAAELARLFPKGSP